MSNDLAVHRSQVGKIGEDLAAAYLLKEGYTLLARNFKARYGEIDLIVRDKHTLIFVEVKTRIGNAFGTPEEAVTPRKLREVIQTAQYYKTQHLELPEAFRVDVIGIVLHPETHVVVYFHHIVSVTS